MKSLINTSLLKEEILKSPVLDFINESLYPGDDLILLQVAGSQVAGLATENSDIDISALSTKSWDLNPSIVGEFQNKHFHWWLCPFDFFFKAYVEPKFLTLFLNGSYYMSFKEENILYINPKYTKLIDFLRNNYDKQKELSIYQLVDCLQSKIEIWKNYKKFPFSKVYAPLIDFYYEKNNLKRNVNLILKAKTSKKTKEKLTDEEQAEIRKALLWTVDYIRSQPYNYKLAGLEWQLEADRILKECQEKC